LGNCENRSCSVTTRGAVAITVADGEDDEGFTSTRLAEIVRSTFILYGRSNSIMQMTIAPTKRLEITQGGNAERKPQSWERKKEEKWKSVPAFDSIQSL
jgi:hypothetical protein